MVPPQRSTFQALLVAGPTALGLWFALMFTHAFVLRGPLDAGALVPYLIMGGVLFGAPVVSSLLVLVALPAWLLLRRTVGVTLGRALLAGGACGLLARHVVGRLWGEPELLFVPIPVVLLAGIGTAWVWWRTWSGPDVMLPGRGAL